MSGPVLVIDDDSDVAESTALALQLADIAALPLAGYAEAGPHLAAATLVLLDINMPGVSGLEALVDLRQKHPRLPVVMLTGLAEIDTAVHCIKQGAADYLVKPVEQERLIAAVRNHQRPSPAVLPLDAEALAELCSNFSRANFLAEASLQAAVLADWLDAHLVEEDCSLRRAAVELNSNTTYLSRLVAAEWGMPFRDLVNRLRLVRLIALMSDPGQAHLSIEALGARVGWHNRSTLFSVVRQLTGRTPAGLRSD